MWSLTNHQSTFIGPRGTLHTYIFWTYRTDKTCSFWTEMTIYEHGKHITTPIGPGLIFCTYRTKKPIRCGLDWPYKVIRLRKIYFWKRLFILNWSDLIWARYTQSRSLEAVSNIFWTYRTDKTCSFWTEMTIYGHGTHILLFEKAYSFWTDILDVRDR